MLLSQITNSSRLSEVVLQALQAGPNDRFMLNQSSCGHCTCMAPFLESASACLVKKRKICCLIWQCCGRYGSYGQPQPPNSYDGPVSNCTAFSAAMPELAQNVIYPAFNNSAQTFRSRQTTSFTHHQHELVTSMHFEPKLCECHFILPCMTVPTLWKVST